MCELCWRPGGRSDGLPRRRVRHVPASAPPRVAAAHDGDLGQLVDLLAADAVFCGDGGGKATAIAEPLHGRDRIAAFLLGISGQILPLGLRAEAATVNGGPGIITRDCQGKVVSVLSLEVLDGVIQALRSVVNPDKLRHLGPVSDTLRIRRPDDDAGT